MAKSDNNPPLADFLAHSMELEAEARERYGELAEAMAAHHNQPVADFFRRMEGEAEHHMQEVTELAGEMALPELHVWDFNWPDAEPPETASYEALHYRMSLKQAIELALENEKAAQSYYRTYAKTTSDDETKKVATRFADEEAEHAAQLASMLQDLPPASAYIREEDDDPHMPE